MVIRDWDTAHNKAFKERMNKLTARERELMANLDPDQQEALLLLKDTDMAWNLRYVSGRRLPRYILAAIVQEYPSRGVKSIYDVLLEEARG